MNCTQDDENVYLKSHHVRFTSVCLILIINNTVFLFRHAPANYLPVVDSSPGKSLRTGQPPPVSLAAGLTIGRSSSPASNAAAAGRQPSFPAGFVNHRSQAASAAAAADVRYVQYPPGNPAAAVAAAAAYGFRTADPVLLRNNSVSQPQLFLTRESLYVLRRQKSSANFLIMSF